MYLPKNKKIALGAKIRRARQMLLKQQPLFAMLLMHMRFVAVPDRYQMSTNGESIFVSPNQLEKYTDNELMYLLCHQMMHIIMGDIWRHIKLAGDEYHYKCDLIADDILLKRGLNRKMCVYMKGITPLIEVDEYGEEKIIHRRMIDTDEFWGYIPCEDEEQVVILESVFGTTDGEAEVKDKKQWEESSQNISDDETEESAGNGGRCGKSEQQNNQNSNAELTKKKLQQLWKDRLDACSKHYDMTLLNEAIALKIGEGQKPKVDWRKELVEFLQEETFDYSFCPPDRRTSEMEFFLPDFNEKDFVLKNVMFWVDTSGSVNTDELGEAYSEIKGALEQFEGKLVGELGFFDTSVTEPEPFESVDELYSIEAYGGGGTDFRPVFDYISDERADNLPACVIIYTDACGAFPNEADVPDIPILWLVNNNEETPPFGKTVRVGI